MSEALIPLWQYERDAGKMEGLVIVGRADKNMLVPKYPFERRASGSCNVTSFINQRIKPYLGEIDVEILDGNAIQPHGRTLLSTCRDTFEK